MEAEPTRPSWGELWAVVLDKKAVDGSDSIEISADDIAYVLLYLHQFVVSEEGSPCLNKCVIILETLLRCVGDNVQCSHILFKIATLRAVEKKFPMSLIKGQLVMPSSFLSWICSSISSASVYVASDLISYFQLVAESFEADITVIRLFREEIIKLLSHEEILAVISIDFLLVCKRFFVFMCKHQAFCEEADKEASAVLFACIAGPWQRFPQHSGKLIESVREYDRIAEELSSARVNLQRFGWSDARKIQLAFLHLLYSGNIIHEDFLFGFEETSNLVRPIRANNNVVFVDVLHAILERVRLSSFGDIFDIKRTEYAIGMIKSFYASDDSNLSPLEYLADSIHEILKLMQFVNNRSRSLMAANKGSTSKAKADNIREGLKDVRTACIDLAEQLYRCNPAYLLVEQNCLGFFDVAITQLNCPMLLSVGYDIIVKANLSGREIECFNLFCCKVASAIHSATKILPRYSFCSGKDILETIAKLFDSDCICLLETTDRGTTELNNCFVESLFRSYDDFPVCQKQRDEIEWKICVTEVMASLINMLHRFPDLCDRTSLGTKCLTELSKVLLDMYLLLYSQSRFSVTNDRKLARARKCTASEEHISLVLGLISAVLNCYQFSLAFNNNILKLIHLVASKLSKPLKFDCDVELLTAELDFLSFSMQHAREQNDLQYPQRVELSQKILNGILSFQSNMQSLAKNEQRTVARSCRHCLGRLICFVNYPNGYPEGDVLFDLARYCESNKFAPENILTAEEREGIKNLMNYHQGL